MSVHLTHLYSGKVRDLYDVSDDLMLMVASDRMSAYDVVMAEPIPSKGRVLTGITHFWLREFSADVASALVSCDPLEIESYVEGFAEETSWHGRSMLVRRAEMLPLECIVRGRLAGQAFEEYEAHGTVHQMSVPAGLRLSDAFASPIFTPSTKALSGHDENISLAAAAELVGEDVLSAAASLCLDLFTRASARLASHGVILADTKFELGWVDGQLVVCDEVLTPDSSRLWPASEVRSGETPPAYDKQPFRDWLTSIGWDRTPPPPPVPADVVAETAQRYANAYAVVTERSLADWYGVGA